MRVEANGDRMISQTKFEILKGGSCPKATLMMGDGSDVLVRPAGLFDADV